MDWMNALDDIVQRYSGHGGGTPPATGDPHEDFQQVSRSAPQNLVAGGISQAFRSDQTPPFPQLVASLFSHSDPRQRAGLLNRLLSSVEPGVLSGISGLEGLPFLMGKSAVTPDQVSPEQVQQIAAHAERQNPSIVDEVSSFCAQHPGVMKAAGGLAVTIALRHILRR
jgi:hypothetical protein